MQNLFPEDAPSLHVERFPIRDNLLRGESGHGYTLRMASANGLSGISLLKRMLGRTRFATLESEDAPRIAHWFGADLTALSTALGSTGVGTQADDYRFCGQVLGRKYFLNRMHPRICDLCLRDDRYCRSFWEIGLATACPRHDVILRERCPSCERSLSWDRPGLDLCQCGAVLTSDSTTTLCSPLERDVSDWIESRTKPVGDIDIDADCPRDDGFEKRCKLARLLTPLTLSGGLRLIYALGTAGRYQQTGVPPSERTKSSVAAAQELLFAADKFIDSPTDAAPAINRITGLTVVTQLLAESASAKSAPADRSLAQSLISALLRHKNRSSWQSRHPQLSQMELF